MMSAAVVFRMRSRSRSCCVTLLRHIGITDHRHRAMVRRIEPRQDREKRDAKIHGNLDDGPQGKEKSD